MPVVALFHLKLLLMDNVNAHQDNKFKVTPVYQFANPHKSWLMDNVNAQQVVKQFKMDNVNAVFLVKLLPTMLVVAQVVR